MHPPSSHNRAFVFFAGVHGVGKTTACKLLWGPAGFHCVTASSIIKAAKGEVSSSKRVTDVDANQRLLVQNVVSLRSTWNHLLMDGHFVIMNRLGVPESIDVSVFEQLSPSVIVCLRDEPDLILQRLRDRDSQTPTANIAAMQDLEIKHAERVAEQLNVPFYCTSPDELPDIVKMLAATHVD